MIVGYFQKGASSGSGAIIEWLGKLGVELELKVLTVNLYLDSRRFPFPGRKNLS